MLSLVAALPGWLFWLILFLLLSAFSLGGLLLLRRKLSPALLAKSHDVAGFYTGVVGVLYTVIVAYCIVAVWEDYTEAESNVNREASAVADMYRSSTAFEDSFGTDLKRHLAQYTDAVINDEWKGLGFSKQADAKTQQQFNAVYHHINSYKPVTAAGNANYAGLLANLKQLSDARRIRLEDSRTFMPLAIWVLLFAGAFIVIAFTWFFTMENLRLQKAMILMIAFIISLTLYIIISLSFPFNGTNSIKPDAFEWLQQNSFMQTNLPVKE